MSVPGTNVYRYLPVISGQQTLGIPFGSIQRILMRSELSSPQPLDTNQDGLQPGVEVITINLEHLLTGRGQREHSVEGSDIIVVLSAPQKIALVVDSIAPMKSVEPESYFVMPAIFDANRALFSGVVCDRDSLTLMVDPDCISRLSAPSEDR